MNIGKIMGNAVGVAQNLTSGAPKIAKTVPTSDLPVSIWDCQIPMPWEVFEAKKANYIKQLYATYFDENGKVIPEIKTFLDETIFNLRTGGGRAERESVSTIKDYIRGSIHDSDIITGTLYHGALRPEAVLAEGFNPRYISRVNLGPGFYFAGQGEAMEYGTVIAAKIKDEGATIARANDRFYENLSGGEVSRKLGEFLGFRTDFSEEARIQSEFIPKIVNEYSRDYIVNDLGIDVLSGYGGASPFDYCTCVLNPSIFEKISRR